MKLSEFKPTEEVLERVRKCTTAEELAALAQEYDVELTAEEISELLKSNSLKELDAEQLDLVAGGDDWGDEKSEHLPKDHGRHIGMYESQGHIGEKVYCVRDNNTIEFCWGVLEKSIELELPCWRTIRVYDIRIEGWNHDTDELQAYNYKNYLDWIHVPVGTVLGEIDASRSTLFLYNK